MLPSADATGRARRRYALGGAALSLAIGWFLFLGYEVSQRANPVVVSRPQALVAPLIVEGPVSVNPTRVRADRILWGSPRFAVQGKELAVLDPSPEGAIRPGENYIVPLTSIGAGRFRVQQVPALGGAGKRITDYPATEPVRRQFEILLEHRQQPKEGGADE